MSLLLRQHSLMVQTGVNLTPEPIPEPSMKDKLFTIGNASLSNQAQVIVRIGSYVTTTLLTQINYQVYSSETGTVIRSGSIVNKANKAVSENISIPRGGWVEFSGKGTSLATTRATSGSAYGVRFESPATSELHVLGNLMSLLYGIDNTFVDAIITQQYAFYGLFSSNMLGLVNAENLILPSNVTSQCYRVMFQGCTKLLVAPKLPATTLANYCYYQMFAGCTQLTTAPDLLADNVSASKNYYYYGMFNSCTRLNSVRMKASVIGNVGSTYTFTGWLASVASTGTFYKKRGVSLPSGASGIPSGWTVVEED